MKNPIQKKSKGIKADSQKVLPVIEGLNNSMNSIEQELENKLIKQQDEIKGKLQNEGKIIKD